MEYTRTEYFMHCPALRWPVLYVVLQWQPYIIGRVGNPAAFVESLFVCWWKWSLFDGLLVLVRYGMVTLHWYSVVGSVVSSIDY